MVLQTSAVQWGKQMEKNEINRVAVENPKNVYIGEKAEKWWFASVVLQTSAVQWGKQMENKTK